jgi:DNA-binding MarR family transcriptional regulator
MRPAEEIQARPLAGNLRLAIGRVARRIRQVYAASGPADESSFTELAILSRLDSGGSVTPTDLAKAERITPQVVGTALTDLAARGFVDRRKDPLDGRRLIVTITNIGRTALDARTEAVTMRLAEALGEGFTAGELRRIDDVLPLLNRLAERL